MDWDQITKALQDFGKDVSDKFKETADVIALRQKANAEKQRIATAYQEIGRLYFKECEGKEIPEEYQEYFDVIAEASVTINEYKSKLEAMSDTKTCPVCGTEMDKEAAYCFKCGAKMPEPEPEPEEAEEEVADADFSEAEPDEVAEEAAEECEEAVEEAAEAFEEEAPAEACEEAAAAEEPAETCACEEAAEAKPEE